MSAESWIRLNEMVSPWVTVIVGFPPEGLE
jgi:hypothetical protein